MKPRIAPADQGPYALLAALKEGTALASLDGKRVTFAGMRGYLITLKVNGRLTYLRAGDPRIAELAHELEARR